MKYDICEYEYEIIPCSANNNVVKRVSLERL